MLFAMVFTAGCGGNDAESSDRTSIAEKMEITEKLTGHWEGLLQVQGQPLWLHLDISPGEDALVPQILVSLPYALVSQQPASQVSLKPDRKGVYELSFKFSLSMAPVSLRLKELSADGERILSGSALVNDRGADVTLHNGNYSRRYREAENAGRAGEEIVLETPNGPLFGTLLEPVPEPAKPAKPAERPEKSPYPVVLLIAGSGPTDRDGNSDIIAGRNDLLKHIAEQLQDWGYGSIRYDKRGSGKSGPGTRPIENYTFADAYGDAERWIHYIETDPRFSRYGILGHSEGSLLALMAGSRTDASWIISAAGNGDPIDDQIYKQLLRQSPAAAEAFRELARNMKSMTTPQQQGMQRDKILEAVTDPTISSIINRGNYAYLVSWMQYDPVKELEACDVPVLVCWGTEDERILKEDNQLLGEADADVVYVPVEGMNHLMKMTYGEQDALVRSYYDPSMPLSDVFSKAMHDFIAVHWK